MKDKEKNWSTLNTRQKVEYFKDYYLVKTICIVAVLLIAIYLCCKIFNKEETILYVACIDDVLEEKEANTLEKELQESLSNGKKHTSVIVDDSFYTTEDGIHKLEVYLSSRQIDLIVADEDTYKTLAAYGFMKDLNGVVDTDEVKTKDKRLLYTAGYKDNDDISFEDKETGKGDILPYGIYFAKEMDFSGLSGKLAKPVIGCASNAKNEENAKKILNRLIEAREK